MERPNLDSQISLIDFQEFYWLKEELVQFCKEIGINSAGNKNELAAKIQKYLATGEIVEAKQLAAKKSNFDWNKETLSKSTIITDNYKNTEQVRAFFLKEIGTHFSFNTKFMLWMKEHTGKTLNDAIAQWNQLHTLKKDKNYKSEITAQFEYNKYIRAFLSDNPNLSIKEAIACWKLKKAKRGTNEYEKKDLNL